MKKKFALILLLTLFGLFAGCNTITGGEEINFAQHQAKKQVITVWLDDTDEVFMDEIIPAFKELYPNIEVNFQHMGTVDSREKLKTYGIAGKGADVFQFPHDHMAQAILDDLVYDLPDELKGRLEERIIPVALDIASLCYNSETRSFECTPGAVKKLFAVPISIESVSLYYNKNLVDEADLPTSFEQLLEDSAAYREANEGKRYFASGSHWADAYFLQCIYSAFGWTPFGPELNDPSEVGFSKQESKDAIDWMIDKLKPEVTGNANHDSINGLSLFEEGELPFILTGPWSIKQFRDAEVNFGNITIPTIAGNSASTFAGAQMVAVYKYSENKDAATKFVEFLQSDTAAQMLYKVSGKCPALKEEILANISGIMDDENFELTSVMLEQLETSIPMPTIPEVTYYWGPAEAMIKGIWNSDGDVDNETENAERAYNASRNLAAG